MTQHSWSTLMDYTLRKQDDVYLLGNKKESLSGYKFLSNVDVLGVYVLSGGRLGFGELDSFHLL